MPDDGAKGVEAILKSGKIRKSPIKQGPMPKPGEEYAGRYTIERLLGRGGMGEVYLARQAPLDRPVALKILKAPETIEDDPNFDARFLREAAAAARLQHPNTITVYDFGQTDEGQLYIVMEFLEGTDVRTSLAHEGIFSAQRAIHVCKQICKSLREAHAKGIIHRDLKPANVLLIERDDDVDFVKVLDFGLVKFRDEVSEITLAGKFLGSPRYTSPESLDRHAIVDHRADIYAAGILLYTMLTGAPPFDGDPMQVLNAHLHEMPKPMYRQNPAAQTTPELEALVARCLEKKPADRFDDMADLLAALREVGAYFGDEHTETLDLELSDGESGIQGALAGLLNRDPEPAPPPPPVVATPPPVSRPPNVAHSGVGGGLKPRRSPAVPLVLGGGLLVLILLVGVGVALLARDSGPPEVDTSDEIEMPPGTVRLDREDSELPDQPPVDGPSIGEATLPPATTSEGAGGSDPVTRPAATPRPGAGTATPTIRTTDERTTPEPPPEDDPTPASEQGGDDVDLPTGYKDNPY